MCVCVCVCPRVCTHAFLILQVMEKYSTRFALLDVMAGKSFCLFDYPRSSVTDILKKKRLWGTRNNCIISEKSYALLLQWW